MNSFEMYISDKYWDSLLIGDVKIIIPHTLARGMRVHWHHLLIGGGLGNICNGPRYN